MSISPLLFVEQESIFFVIFCGASKEKEEVEVGEEVDERGVSETQAVLQSA